MNFMFIDCDFNLHCPEDGIFMNMTSIPGRETPRMLGRMASQSHFCNETVMKYLKEKKLKGKRVYSAGNCR